MTRPENLLSLTRTFLLLRFSVKEENPMDQAEESGEWMKRIASFFRDSLRISPREAFLRCCFPETVS
jgi:hypothetical protein